MKNEEFNVYYNKMELLLIRLEFLVVYLSWRRSIAWPDNVVFAKTQAC